MKKARREFLRFVIVGGAAAVVNIASRYVINYFVAYGYAVVIAYIFGMVMAFALSKAFVFAGASGRDGRGQFARFILVNILAAAQVWLISIGLADYIFPALGFVYYPYDVAHVIGVICPVFTSYFGHKYFSFRV